MRRRNWTAVQRALGAILLLVLAGCLGSPPSSTSSSSATTTPPPPHVVFDGAAALDFVKGFALHADGSPRYRMPGTAGQAEGAAYLWANTDVPGWARTWQNFTGADYLALNRSSVADYGPGSPYCPQADLAALPSWPFHNLLAVRSSGRTGAPLLLLGAHWDSQMHSDAERNATRKSWPDPGANDGASGVGVLLQLMHQLNATLPFDVGILFIDGEDGFFDCYPIAGALQFVQHPPVAVRRFILLDMVGDPAARFARERNSMASDPDLMDALWQSRWRRRLVLAGGGHHRR